MFEYQEKRRIKRILYSKPAIVILLVLILLLANAVWGVYEKARGTGIKKAEIKRELDELAKRREELKREIDRLSTVRGIESELRSKFNVARAGEGVIVIVESGENEDEVKQTADTRFWSKFLSWFKF